MPTNKKKGPSSARDATRHHPPPRPPVPVLVRRPTHWATTARRGSAPVRAATFGHEHDAAAASSNREPRVRVGIGGRNGEQFPHRNREPLLTFFPLLAASEARNHACQELSPRADPRPRARGPPGFSSAVPSRPFPPARSPPPLRSIGSVSRLHFQHGLPCRVSPTPLSPVTRSSLASVINPLCS